MRKHVSQKDGSSKADMTGEGEREKLWWKDRFGAVEMSSIGVSTMLPYYKQSVRKVRGNVCMRMFTSS